MPWAIGKKLEWLGRALLSPSGEGPRQFDDGPVTPVLDVLQLGAANALISPYVDNRVGLLPAQSWTVLPANNNVTRLVWFSFTHNAGATAIDVSISLAPPLNVNDRVQLGKGTITPTSTNLRRLTHTELLGSMEPIRVLPGCALLARHEGIAAAEELHSRGVILEAPAGSHPW